MTCHDVMFAELGWCPQISNILWLPSVDIRMLRDHFKTWAPEDSEAFAPWFFGRIWPLLNPWNRWNLWVQWWMDLQSRHKVEKKKVHDVAFNGKHLFVIPTSQLKTATHIFRNLNRWKIDRKGHDLDLARQRAAGCGCCWSLGRCTTGQACQPLFNFGFVFFPTVSKYKVGILTVWHQAMLGLGAAGGFIWPNFLILLGQRALGRLCSSFGSLKWGGIHQQYPVHYIINFIQFHILYYYYNIIIL